MSNKKKILLTGVTGYVGHRLLIHLFDQNEYHIRCLARRPSAIRNIEEMNVEIFRGDLQDFETTKKAMEGVDTAFYLVHSLRANKHFEEMEHTNAQNFAEACKVNGVRRIIYLGGIAGHARDLSPHMSTRVKTGGLLRQSGAQVIELRASIIIGSGSISFELIRALVRKLPIMITPKWVRVKAQPIAINDVIEYLSKSIELDESKNLILDIGGQDAMSYGDLMHLYAKIRGVKRYMIPVPFLTPYLSSLWLALVTPIYASIGRKLIDSMTESTQMTNFASRDIFDIEPIATEEAIRLALRKEDHELSTSNWYDALSAGPEVQRFGGVKLGSRLIDYRRCETKYTTEQSFKPIARIGGKTGWYYANFLWRIRGFMDILVGGVGMRRGRPDPEIPHVGDALDFWRVEAYEPNKRLRLRAEMRVPGRAWLEYVVEPKQKGNGAIIHQYAIFDPLGLWGLLYWYSVWPLHQIIFHKMVRNIGKAAAKD
ncbi:MAG: SDR family oxidoreductase [Lentisphaeria bacterium]|nr:SDR family oxidoreductase [Lentisphaeria bacterium]